MLSDMQYNFTGITIYLQIISIFIRIKSRSIYPVIVNNILIFNTMKPTTILLLFAILFGGCATVKFYDDPEFTKKSGIEFYSAKPYLLVEKEPAKDVAERATIVYLPDMSRPKYARIVPGIGSSDLKLTLSNGMITSYGVTVDSKIPETMESFSKIIGSAGTSAASIGSLVKTFEQSGDVSSMKNAEDCMDLAILEMETIKDSELLTGPMKTKINEILENLKALKKKTNNYNINDIPEICDGIDKILNPLSAITIENKSDQSERLIRKIETIKKNLLEAKKLMSQQNIMLDETKPSFELFEIIIGTDKTILKKVEI